MSESTEMEGAENNAIASLTVRDPRARRLRSLVWNDFTKERKADGNCVAICNHCKKQLTASSRSGTTHLKNHLAICLSTKRSKRKKLVVRRLVLRPGEMKHDGSGNLEGSQFDQELSRQDLARMIVLHGYPFAIVHHPGFQTFVRNLQPQFKLMSHDVVKSDCMEIYEKARLKLRESLEKLSCRVSVTVDKWRSVEDVEYLGLTGHYIDDEWKLKRRILNLWHLEFPLPGEEISKTIVERLHDWNIHRKLCSVVLDDCPDSDVVARELPKFLRPKGALPLNGELFHVRSCATILALIVQDGMEVACTVINKVRNVVQYVKSTQEKLNEFQNAAKQVGSPQKLLVLDVPNNWSSTYLMLAYACELREAFTCLADFDAEFINSLSSDDWGEAKAVAECLEVFYHAIEKFSGARIPTSNLYFNDICGIHLLLKTWCTSLVPVVATMASQMLEKFEEHWGMTRVVMAIASILDPRFKMKSIEYFFKRIYVDTYEANTRTENIRKCLTNLYKEYVVQSSNTARNQFLCYGGSGSGTSDWRMGGDSKTSSRAALFDTQRGLDQYLQEASSNQPLKSDMDLYLEEPVHPSKSGLDDNFNILAWWKFNAAKYPVLSMMARDILAVPVSVVPDNEGRMINQYLNSMDPLTVQGLICGQDWLRDDFEVAPQEPGDGILTILAPANVDGDVDEEMAPVNGDEFSPLSK